MRGSATKRTRRPAFLGAAWGLLSAVSGAGALSRPNALWIVLDDLGIGEPGCYGGIDLPTPRLDAVAAEGVRFSSAYVTAPYCAPSRASLLTGRHCARIGFGFNPTGARTDELGAGLPPSERTFADHLRAAGYATGAVGKWHLGGAAPCLPMRRGFEEFCEFLREGHFYVPPPWDGHTTWLRRRVLPNGLTGRQVSRDGCVIWSDHMGRDEPPYDADNPILRGRQPVSEPCNLTDAFTREAIAFMFRHRSQPWFLYVAYNAVHSALQAPTAWGARFANVADWHRRVFLGLAAHLDDAVGRLLDALDASGQAGRTLVLILSDNGGPTAELTSSNRPFRGGKGQLYEGGIRVPMWARWPGRLPAGRVESRPVSSMDWMATTMAAAGLPIPSGLDGVHLLPFLATADSRSIHDRLCWRYGGQAAIREGPWKLLRRRHGDAWKLYDLATDPGESTDIAGRHPDVRDRLVERGSTWAAGLPSPRTDPSEPFHSDTYRRQP